jgi:hypothetical protein
MRAAAHIVEEGRGPCMWTGDSTMNKLDFAVEPLDNLRILVSKQFPWNGIEFRESEQP